MARPPTHPLFAAALAATPDYVHDAPIHMGGPQPMVPRMEQNEIIRWCGEQLVPFVRDLEERARFADLIEQARDLHRQPPKRNGEAGSANANAKARAREKPVHVLNAAANADELYRALNVLGGNAGQDDPLSIARFVAISVKRSTETQRNVVRTARAVTLRTARILALNHMPPEYFLELLDQRLVRAELIGCARRYCRDIEERLDSITYRGGDEKGDTVVWIARVQPRTVDSQRPASAPPQVSWGALVRHVGFHWAEGSREEALAMVQEDHLERAAAAAFA